jgi:hypothetical protein
MAAPKGDKELNRLFDEIINDISENGKSLIAALKGRMSASTFYGMIQDKEKSQIYARACESRAEVMANEILEISDSPESKDNAVVQRDRLRVDTRKWLLAKLHPKKYGDKLDVEHSGNIILHFDEDDKQA